jgi:hypothetical protein
MEDFDGSFGSKYKIVEQETLDNEFKGKWEFDKCHWINLDELRTN